MRQGRQGNPLAWLLLLVGLSGCASLGAESEPPDGGSPSPDMGVVSPPIPFFASRYNLSQGLGEVAAAISDLDGDNYPDVVVANPFSGTVTVLRNDHSGCFPAALKQAYVQFSGPAAVAIADVDRDGTPDVVVAESGSDRLSVMFNQKGAQQGSFDPDPQKRMKIAVGQKPVALALGNLGPGPSTDLAVANTDSGSVSVLPDFPLGGKKDYTAFSPLYAVVLADLNGDKLQDLVLPDAGMDGVRVLWNRGDGTFLSGKCGGLTDGCSRFPTDRQPVSVVAADLDGDQRPDLALTNYGSSTLTLLHNQGDTTFMPTSLPVGDSPVYIAAADLDKDGLPDLLVAERGSGKVRLLRNRGGFQFDPGQQALYDAGTAPTFVAISDLNNDGRPDFIALDAMNDTVYVYLNAAQCAAKGP